MWEMQQAAGSGCCLAMLLPLVIYVRTRQFDHVFAQPGSPASWLLHRAEASPTVNRYIAFVSVGDLAFNWPPEPALGELKQALLADVDGRQGGQLDAQ